MKKAFGVTISLVFFLFAFTAFAASNQKSITNISSLEQAIQEMGYEKAISQALESGYLSMEQISKTVLSNTKNEMLLVDGYI